MNLDVIRDLVDRQAAYGASVFIHAMMSDDPNVRQRAIESLEQLEEDLCRVERIINDADADRNPFEQLHNGEETPARDMVKH